MLGYALIRWRLFILIAIAGCGLLLADIVSPCFAAAQEEMKLEGTVRDESGRPIPGAKVVAHNSGAPQTIADCDRTGHFIIVLPQGSSRFQLRANAPGLESDLISVSVPHSAASLVLTLHSSSVRTEVTVTATRSSLDLPATATLSYTIGSKQLQDFPATALDDKLRQQAGFELFRRASSTIANPTSQGVSLRGLGSTAASRTLVLESGVPLNDPFGGWIHWDELPENSIDSIGIATGGGSDLYGSSALGGVIDVVPSRPQEDHVEAIAFGGGEDTSLLGLRGDVAFDRWRQLLAGESFRTAGYIPTASNLAGPVDVPADLHYQSLRSETDHVFSSAHRAFLDGSLLNEARDNGTQLQTNGTRLWRYFAGDDWSGGTSASVRGRLFGSDEAYRQSFSAVNAARTTETLTRLQQVRTEEIGASSDASFAFAPVAVVTGFDIRDIRATDDETPINFGLPGGLADTTARQRFIGVFGELLGSRGRWSAAVSLRLDRAWNLDTHSITLSALQPQPVFIPNRSEFIASPRLGVVRSFGSVLSLRASGFRAFRTPTMNELYRTGQVGQEITQANAQLASERGTGWDIGSTFAAPGGGIALRATYFWTEINRPVSAVLVSSNATSILERRENLGQILSQGTEVHMDVRPRSELSATLGYQYAHAIVTQFSAQTSLVGKWIPQVPRHSFTGQLRAEKKRVGELTLAARAVGHAYDDSANSYPLASFFTLDLFARHSFGAHWSMTFTGQNLLNQRVQVARTPVLTLGSPALLQGGVDFHWTQNRTN